MRLLMNKMYTVGEVSREGGEELYAEVLYCLTNMIGSDAKSTNQFQLVEHLRKAFHIEPQCHLQIYSQVQLSEYRLCDV
jgi:hypothetical protein